jgi:uncharacterized SAM-binding protein YcdF (DUF218 family)
VTHSDHLPRALAQFRAAAGEGLLVLGAPVGSGAGDTPSLLQWLPSNAGQDLSRRVLREWLGARLGA